MIDSLLGQVKAIQLSHVHGGVVHTTVLADMHISKHAHIKIHTYQNMPPHILPVAFNPPDVSVTLSTRSWLQDCNEAIERDPKEFAAWFNKGNALARLQDYAGALESYRTAADLAPGIAGYRSGSSHDAVDRAANAAGHL